MLNATISLLVPIWIIFICNNAYATTIKDWEQSGFWYEHRLLFIGVLVVLLILSYKSVWDSYKKWFRLHRETPFSSNKPPLTTLQASYLYSQQEPLCFTAWLVQACRSGALTLHCHKGPYPWSISKNMLRTSASSLDQQLLDILFRDGNELGIHPVSSKPNPKFENAFRNIIGHIKEDTADLIQPKPISIPAWILLLALLMEMPFLNGLGALVYTIPAFGLVAFSAVILFALCKSLPVLLGGKNVLLWAAITIFLSIGVIVHWGFLGASFTGPYFILYFYPEVVAAIGVLVVTAPSLPKDMNLLMQILGYRKYLAQKSYPTKEHELEWTLGLNLHADIFDNDPDYQDDQLPQWLIADESEPKKVIQRLHLELPGSIKSAIYGESEGPKRRSTLQKTKDRL